MSIADEQYKSDQEKNNKGEEFRNQNLSTCLVLEEVSYFYFLFWLMIA